MAVDKQVTDAAKIYWVYSHDEAEAERIIRQTRIEAGRTGLPVLYLDAVSLKQIYAFDFDHRSDAESRKKSVERDVALCRSLQEQEFCVIYRAEEAFPEILSREEESFIRAAAGGGTMLETEESGIRKKGTFYFVTGLSAAGKTTMGSRLYQRLRAMGRDVLFMDGDLTRALFHEYDYTRPYRERTAYRDSRMCKWFTDQGIDVISCGICMFHGLRKWHRENILHYCEIYLDVPMKVLEQRDPKGLYAQARAGTMKDVVGVDQLAEFPQNPDIRFVNDGSHSPEEAFEIIWKQIQTML